MEVPLVQHRVLSVPREGAGIEEYEDGSSVLAKEWPVCAAVADGATESVFSGLWARILANGVVNASITDEASFSDAVPTWREEWTTRVESEAGERPWYVNAKLQDGAHATVLSLSVERDGVWRALSVGDCCLFHIREGQYRESWPYEQADAFNDRPGLVPSRKSRPIPSVVTTSGTWSPGDSFVLATDATAEWLLRTGSASVPSSVDALEQNVLEARRAGTLRNDDVTIVVLHLAEPEIGTAAD